MGSFPPRARSPHETIEALAAIQHGVVSRSQLLAAGLSEASLERRVTARRLHPLHRSVYRVGPLESLRTRAMAAVLACGGAAVVSHETAAALWRLLPEPPSGDPVHVSLLRGDRRRPDIVIHRTYGLRRGEITVLERIPITTPARTLLDVAGTVEDRELARALSEALVQRMTTRAALIAALRRNPRHAGAGLLGDLLGLARPALTRSEAEKRFLRMIHEAMLPAPEVNIPLEGFKVDFLWRIEGFVVEIDGFAAHAITDRFEADRLRDATLAAAGVRVMRVTWRQLVNQPYAVVVRLAQALARSARVSHEELTP